MVQYTCAQEPTHQFIDELEKSRKLIVFLGVLMLALLRRASFFDHPLWSIFQSSLHISLKITFLQGVRLLHGYYHDPLTAKNYNFLVVRLYTQFNSNSISITTYFHDKSLSLAGVWTQDLPNTKQMTHQWAAVLVYRL